MASLRLLDRILQFFRQCDIFIFLYSSDKNVKKSMVFDGDQNKYISNLLQSNIEHKITTLYGMKNKCTNLIANWI
jgi:hypothetical protein